MATQPRSQAQQRRRFAVAVGPRPDARRRCSLALLVVLAAVPAFAGRAALQDLFFVFTMLALAQYWNLLAGYAGLVSVGQQAFVGLGAYALFAATLIANLDPLIAILIGGVVAAVLGAADRARRLPPARRLFRHRHLGRGGGLPPDPRAGEAARRRHRHVARPRHHQRRWPA